MTDNYRTKEDRRTEGDIVEKIIKEEDQKWPLWKQILVYTAIGVAVIVFFILAYLWNYWIMGEKESTRLHNLRQEENAAAYIKKRNLTRQIHHDIYHNILLSDENSPPINSDPPP